MKKIYIFSFILILTKLFFFTIFWRGNRYISIECWFDSRGFAVDHTCPQRTLSDCANIKHLARTSTTTKLSIVSTLFYYILNTSFIKTLLTSPLIVNLCAFRNSKSLSGEGYWREAAPTVSTPLCAASDPAGDFRWHALGCGGPEVASFVCELPGKQHSIVK